MIHRRAVSLIELVVMMSAATVIIFLTSVLLHRVMHIQSRAWAQMATERSALRISSQFRHDVHAATSMTLGDEAEKEKVLVRLERMDGRSIVYSRSGDSLLRRESGGDKPEWREEYRLPPGIELELVEHEEPRRLSLVIESPAGTKEATLVMRSRGSIHLHVEPVVGRDLPREAPVDGEEGAL